MPPTPRSAEVIAAVEVRRLRGSGPSRPRVMIGVRASEPRVSQETHHATAQVGGAFREGLDEQFVATRI